MRLEDLSDKFSSSNAPPQRCPLKTAKLQKTQAVDRFSSSWCRDTGWSRTSTAYLLTFTKGSFPRFNVSKLTMFGVRTTLFQNSCG